MTEWRYVIPGWGKVIEPVDEHGRDIDDGLSWLQIRDRLVGLLENSSWYKHQPAGSDLHEAIAEFKQADDDEDVEDLLMRIYDLADEQRCWLDPFDMSVN